MPMLAAARNCCRSAREDINEAEDSDGRLPGAALWALTAALPALPSSWDARGGGAAGNDSVDADKAGAVCAANPTGEAPANAGPANCWRELAGSPAATECDVEAEAAPSAPS